MIARDVRRLNFLRLKHVSAAHVTSCWADGEFDEFIGPTRGPLAGNYAAMPIA